MKTKDVNYKDLMQRYGYNEYQAKKILDNYFTLTCFYDYSLTIYEFIDNITEGFDKYRMIKVEPK